MLDGKLNQYINPEVVSASIEAIPDPELVKKTMAFFKVDEKEATEYLVAERKRIKEKNESKQKEEYQKAA